MVTVPRGLTLEDFLRLPEEKPALEYLDGRVTQKVSPKVHHSRLQSKLSEFVNLFTEPQALAIAFTELRTTFGGASLVPDVAIFTWARLPVDASGELLEECFSPPDVAIEIVSPDQSVASLVRKCRWYVEHGVPIALLVDPRRRTVRDFRPGPPPRTLTGADTIDLGDVIPGLALRVDDVFAVLRIPGARPRP